MTAFFDSILRILALLKKEMLYIVRDPRNVATLIGPMLIQCFIFGYATSYDLTNIPYALLDESRSDASREMVSYLDGAGIFHRAYTIESPREIARLVDEGRVVFVLSIGSDFEREIVSGRTANVQIISDGRNSNTAATALGYANTAIESFNAYWRSKQGVAAPEMKTTTRAWYNPTLETRWSMIPALIGTLTLIQVMLLASRSVAYERECGTFDQLLVTPLRPFEIMIGKALPVFIVGLVQATLILLVAQLWFCIPFEGTLLPLFAGLFAFIFASVGIGLFISSLAVNMQQAMMYSFVILMPAILLSGFTTPIANMPDWIQFLTYFNPLRYSIDISRRVYLDGATLAEITPQLAAMTAIAAITLPCAAWFFRRKLY
jgi:ABC-2 type transport system permease protein